MAPSITLQQVASGRDVFGAEQTTFEHEAKQRRMLLRLGSKPRGRRGEWNRVGRGDDEMDLRAYQKRQLFDPLGRLNRVQDGASKAINNLLNPTRLATPESATLPPPEAQPAPTSTVEDGNPVQPTDQPSMPIQLTSVLPPAAAPVITRAPPPDMPAATIQPPPPPTTTPVVSTIALLPNFIVCITCFINQDKSLLRR